MTRYYPGGLVHATVPPKENATTYLYDKADRRIALIDPHGKITTSVYYSDGQLQAGIDPLGHVTTHVYDRVNRPL